MTMHFDKIGKLFRPRSKRGNIYVYISEEGPLVKLYRLLIADKNSDPTRVTTGSYVSIDNYWFVYLYEEI